MRMQACAVLLFAVWSSLAGAAPARAQATQARLDRIVLLRSARGVSLVLELTAEPEKAMIHSVAGAIVAIDVGPVAERVAAHALDVPAGIPLIERVDVEDFSVADARFLRARVDMTGPTRANLRVVGRRVYVDIAPVAPPRALDARPGDGTPREPALRPGPSGQRAGPEPRRFQEAITPIIQRLEEMAPFVLSAATSQDPQVLEALQTPLNAVHDSLTRLKSPDTAQSGHTLLMSAVMMARRAVTPEFPGDRVAQAHRAMAMLEAAKDQLTGRTEP